MNRRRNYLIKKTFQFKFIFAFAILLLIECALIVGFFVYVSKGTITTGYVNSILKVESSANFFLVSFLLISAIVFVGVVLASTAVLIFLSHRVAGPLYKFEKFLQSVESGNLTGRIVLRKTDQLAELKSAMNSLVVSLDKRLGLLKARVSELEAVLASPNSAETVAKARAATRAIKTELDRFLTASAVKE